VGKKVKRKRKSLPLWFGGKKGKANGRETERQVSIKWPADIKWRRRRRKRSFSFADFGDRREQKEAKEKAHKQKAGPSRGFFSILFLLILHQKKKKKKKSLAFKKGQPFAPLGQLNRLLLWAILFAPRLLAAKEKPKLSQN